MTNTSISDINNPKDSGPEYKEIFRKTTNDLSSDPDYVKLLEHFQVAEFSECQQRLEELEERYPGHPILLKFKDELELKLSVNRMTTTINKAEKHYKRKSTFNLMIFAVISTIVIVVAFFLSMRYFIGTGAVEPAPTPEDTAPSQLIRLYDQAEGLLQVGQPGPAAQIIEQIRTIDPEYPDLEDITTRTKDLLRLEDQYQAALGLVALDRVDEALAIFQNIEAEQPGLWDVSRQIISIEKTQQIAQYLSDASAAFQAQDWGQVISAYENAEKLDFKLNDPLLKEQLLRSYLNQIILMLENNDTSIEEIELAEGYYRKATALFPQSREFTSERGNLQELTSSLLEIKFTQIAKANLADKYQTSGSVAQAVAYLRKAANLKPKNTALQQDLKNAEYYQIGFQSFIDMNWVDVVNKLSQVISVDPNYADGNASILLFEAYYAMGKQYYAAGIYLDALKNLEQAELQAWGRLDNLMQLLQVQTLLGNTFGKMEDYENAVSYYQYALNAIEIYPRLTGFPAMTTNYNAANVSIAYDNYEEAFIAYQEILKDIEVIYTTTEVEIRDGACIALFAHANLSTLDAVLNANNLQNDMVITFGRNLQVPMIEK